MHQAHLLQHVGQLLTQQNRHVEAEQCFARGVQLAPDSPPYLYNWATSLIALGRMAEAEELLTRVLTLNPHDYDAQYNRSTLRRQTTASNHICELERALVRPTTIGAEAVPLYFALAKELEDLGEHERSFDALKRGADARRRVLSYRVEEDVAMMRQISAVLGQSYFSVSRAGYRDGRPIFVLGLPRSGTTLVDRILSTHSGVRSRGETTDFVRALVQVAGACGSKVDLLARSATLSVAALGHDYCSQAACSGAERFIDKTPINFLYLGLIAQALPHARIIHVRRNPMDVCYAMYKTLFRMAYPFSYDLADIAQYYLAYHRLMSHWHAMLPDRIFDLDYEDLVMNQEAVSRRLFAHCDLDWQEACLAFERNDSPCLTASAAQVRKPIYQSSVGLWRHYERQLQPLADRLRAGGIEVEAS